MIKIRINFNNSKILISINQSPIPSFFLQGLYLNVSPFPITRIPEVKARLRANIFTILDMDFNLLKSYISL